MRLIDADRLKDVPMFNGQYDKKNANENFIYGIEIVIDFINELPTVDRPEIVRCKDCKHRGNSEKCVLSAISEEKDYPLFMLDNRGEWFCADGERRKENA